MRAVSHECFYLYFVCFHWPSLLSLELIPPDEQSGQDIRVQSIEMIAFVSAHIFEIT
jgi:hypothetical protein